MLAASLTGAKAADVYSGESLKDAPVAVASDWTGFYIGIHGGYADGEWDGEPLFNGGDAGFSPSNRSVGADGALGGVQIGYNKQFNSVVLGIEADISATDFEGSETFVAGPFDTFSFPKKHELELEYFGTVRARAGYAMGRFLPYVTGGLAWGKTNGDLTVNLVNDPEGVANDLNYVSGRGSVDEDHFGYTIGGGVEAMLGRGWTLKAEYLYVDLGEEDYEFKGDVFNPAGAVVAPFDTDSYKSDLTFDVFRVGLNYKFGAREHEPLK